jgi:transcriptional regulator with XRE-family HTH domain
VVTASRDLPRDIGGFIRDLRRNAQISLRQLAEQAGVSNPYLSQIERGLRKPSAEVLAQLAHALRVSTPMMYLRAGLLDSTGGHGVLAAIAADPDLNIPQKQSLTQIYETFRRENARSAAGTDDEPSITITEPAHEQAGHAAPAAPQAAKATGTRSAAGTAAKGTTAKGTTAKGTTAKGTTAKGTTAKGTTAKGTATRPASGAKATAAKATPAKKAAPAKATPAKATPAKATPARAEAGSRAEAAARVASAAKAAAAKPGTAGKATAAAAGAEPTHKPRKAAKRPPRTTQPEPSVEGTAAESPDAKENTKERA